LRFISIFWDLSEQNNVETLECALVNPPKKVSVKKGTKRILQDGGKSGYPGCETEFLTEIVGVPIVLIPDHQEEACIADFKVVKDKRTANTFYKPESSFQLQLYSSVFNKANAGYYLFCKKEGVVLDAFTEFDLPKLKKWVAYIVSSVAQAIRAEAFPPCEPKFLCAESWCSQWDRCKGQAF
jgi:hypothetical protein